MIVIPWLAPKGRKAEAGRIDLQLGGEQRREVAEALALALDLDKLREEGGVAGDVLQFLGKVSRGVAADRHGIDIGEGDAPHRQTARDREARKARVILDSVQALLGDGRHGLPVD